MTDRDTSAPGSVCETDWGKGVRTNHSEDLVVVGAGELPPYVFCGFHATHYLQESIRVARKIRAEQDKDPDRETCSWCVDEVPDVSLTTIVDGARLCRSCLADHLQGKD